MDKAKFDVILEADSPTFIEDLRKALGLKEGETVNLITPQFERTDGRTIRYYPSTKAEYDALPGLSRASLEEIGCGKWNKENGTTHWLFPKEWYGFIPDGTQVVSISGKTESFVKGKTDDDIRYGMLAYGFLQTEH